MTNTAVKRPVTITVICILGLIGGVLGLMAALSPFFSGIWQIIFILLSVGAIASMWGLWQMKKWGAHLYIGVQVINQVIVMALGVWTVGSIIIPGIVVALVLAAYKDMK